MAVASTAHDLEPFVSRPIPPAGPRPPGRPCRNCGEHVAKAFCPACGQDYAAAQRLSLKEAAMEAIQVFHYDGRVVRDLCRLLVRPGALTLDYVEGRRTGHLPPGRLFFMAYVAFFFAIQHIDSFEIAGAMASISPDRLAALAASHGWSADVLNVRLEAALTTAYPMWFFLLVPPIAGLVWLFNWRARRPLVVHGVFALHALAAVMLLNIPDMCFADPRLATYAYWFANFLVIPVYLFVAMRRVYGSGRLVTAAKVALFWPAFLATGWVYVDFVVAWTVWTL